MPPIVTFVRHAQGFHNLCEANHAMRDPLLTDLGKQQCQTLSEVFHHTDIDLVVASPLKRTIYTALYSFPEQTRQHGIIALPDVQETSNLPCDTGSDRAEIEREFADKEVKLHLAMVTEDWHSKQGRYAPERNAIEARARDARQWLKARKEHHIVCVSHGGVLHYLTEDWTDHGKFEGTGWANTEYRTYTFDPASNSSASLIETEESIQRRQPPKPLTQAEKVNLASVHGVDEKKLSAKV